MEKSSLTYGTNDKGEKRTEFKPTELRNEEAALRREIDLEDENTAGIFSFLPFFCCCEFCNNHLEWILFPFSGLY